MFWQTRRFRIDLSQPRVMGIVNVTPDSFSDGGLHASTEAAIAQCERLVAEGADVLDIGGESTRPGAAAVSVQEELARVLPVLAQALKLDVPVSVDTSRAEVVAAVLQAGADIVNDIRALRSPGALQAFAGAGGAGLCLMHMQGEPATMQTHPHYDDVAAEVAAFLHGRASAARSLGVAHECIVLDPGFGFGKTLVHNLELHRHLDRLHTLGYPLLAGWSRKSALGAITGRAVGERLPASLAAALAAAQAGARILRVHDVAATVDALKVWRAMVPPASTAPASH